MATTAWDPPRAGQAPAPERPARGVRPRVEQRAAPADFATLLSAAQAGGSWAIERLYRSLDPRVRRYLRAHIGQDADDVAADTWLDVARNLQTFAGDEDAFRAWVFTIANRRLVDHLRRRGRRHETTSIDGDHGTAAPSAEAVAFDSDLADEAAARIVASLPREQARIVLLRVVAGLSVDEVAVLVGRRPGHVRVLQHRALSKLAKNLSRDL